MDTRITRRQAPPEQAITPVPQQSGTAIAAARGQAEVLASFHAAHAFPRDEVAARARILQACRRPKLAQEAIYAYPRGETTVKGPSIRLAEVIAAAWGNMECGWGVVARRDSESDIEAFAIDLETNFRDVRRFPVRHWRDTKGGGYPLKEERDIYELCANQAARRLRACLLQVIPGDIVEEAVEECARTVAHGGEVPFPDLIVALVDKFRKHGVTVALIEQKLGCAVGKMLPTQYSELVAIFNALNSKEGKVADFFKGQEPAAPTDLASKAAAAVARATAPPAAEVLDAQVRDVTPGGPEWPGGQPPEDPFAVTPEDEAAFAARMMGGGELPL